MTTITPVLLAGGTGTRLWPLSRKSYPKQFAKVLGETTLFEETAMRFKTSDMLDFAPPITLTNNDFRFIVTEQLQAVGIDPGPILIEPEVKNTGPAVLAACLHAASGNQDPLLLVVPTDHVIPNTEAFQAALTSALPAIKKKFIVTFGVTPTRPETGFGYLELSEEIYDEAFVLERFVEKPNLKAAQSMMNDQRYLWNAGIFLFRASDMISAYEKYAPLLFRRVESALNSSSQDLGFIRIDPENWALCDNISVDYAIMEKSDNLVACPFSAGWSDLGGWDAVWQEMGPDQDGVAISQNAHAFDCKNTMLRSESDAQELVGIGLENILAIAMTDAVLIVHKDQAQNVKSVLTELKAKNVSQAELLGKDYRPWGWFERLTIHDRFQVKKIFVKPGGALSLQNHHHRSEHWIVVEGTARVTINEDIKLVSEGQSVYIPLGAVHRMENPGKLPMILIEVQTGAYLGEDDIVRYKDIYSRT